MLTGKFDCRNVVLGQKRMLIQEYILLGKIPISTEGNKEEYAQ